MYILYINTDNVLEISVENLSPKAPHGFKEDFAIDPLTQCARRADLVRAKFNYTRTNASRRIHIRKAGSPYSYSRRRREERRDSSRTHSDLVRSSSFRDLLALG